jgi:hypothetical protein
VHRVVLILLTLVVAPSLATASWYRCGYDGVVRSTCCCPARADRHEKPELPAPEPSVRAACCCTVAHVASTAPDGVRKAAAPLDLAPTTLPEPSAAAPPRVARAPVAPDRPRALGAPPDTLFARRCSLLL